MSQYALIAVSGPLKRSFTYHMPPRLDHLYPGQRVLVPFGRTRKVGFFLKETNLPPNVKPRDILRTIETNSLFSTELYDFCMWMADYYFANPADCLSAALPPISKRAAASDYFWSDTNPENIPDNVRVMYRAGSKLSKMTLDKIASLDPQLLPTLIEQTVILERWPDKTLTDTKRIVGFRTQSPQKWEAHFARKKSRRLPFDGVKTRPELKTDGWTDYQIRTAVRAGILATVSTNEPLPLLDFIQPLENLREIILNEGQLQALNTLKQSLHGGFQSYLLHGITGSGKTILYCHLCREVIQKNKTALVLTPEITLTSTTLAYFRGFFGDRVTVIHSAMTEKQRLESWRGIKNGRFSIVIGPRSAVFAPLEKLGVIIVDEEHDGSYKQDDPAPRFHGRDAAIMRAKINKIPVVLGSASPSLESYHNALRGRCQLLQLAKRPAGAALPTIRIIDMKSDRLRGDLTYISYTLKKSVESCLARGEQVILYLNRRGHSPQIKCADCGLVSKCPNCRVNLTYHRAGGKLNCHYCGYLLNHYDECPACGGNDFLYQGVGTQKVEDNLPRLFESALTTRLDSDAATERRLAYKILTDFAARKNNLLLGTQMVTKGLDFPGVTLVGVLSADQSLEWPDFRASEKAFSRLLQVAGRSGRSASPGEVIIQTYYPEHEVINDAARQDYRTFYNREIQSRKDLAYPPFTRLVNFVLTAKDERRLEKESLAFRDRLVNTIDAAKMCANLLGPTPCPMYRLRGHFRRHLFIKIEQIVKFVRMLTEWESSQPRFGLPGAVKLTVDVDPDDMM